MEYIFGLDISMSNTGLAIFDEKMNPVEIISIPTKSGMEHKDRLKTIADRLLEIRKKYPTSLIILESGFSRYAASTQAIYKCHGLIQYIFCDAEQVLLAPSSIKKLITGSGKADKHQVQEKILKKFPKLQFKNEDESDAVGACVAYFVQTGSMKL
jgi:Holliday junction resolvasome RuvABC endonuclease subunit